MKSIATLVVCAISGIACVNLSAHAAEGNHTISLGYAHFQFPGLKDFVKDATAHNRETFSHFVNRNYFSSLGEYTDGRVSGSVDMKARIKIHRALISGIATR